MKLIFFWIVCALSLSPVFAQYRFTRFPNELYLGFGHVIYQGDVRSTSPALGGENRAFNLQEINGSFTIGYGHRFKRKWAFRNNLTLMSFSGDDALDQSREKRQRNLSFRTHMIEYAPLLEYSLKHWDIKGYNKHHHVYVASGLNLFYFNPQANYMGEYYNLQPLSTEGQGFTGAKPPYRRISWSLPLVWGYRYKANRNLVFGLETSVRKSFTDYLDDVSGTYYENNVIRANNGDIAAQLADPNLSGSPRKHGTGRGNPAKGDNYFYFIFLMSYFIGSF